MDRISPWRSVTGDVGLKRKIAQADKITKSLDTLLKFSKEYFKDTSVNKFNHHLTRFLIDWIDKEKLSKLLYRYFGMFHVIVHVFNYIFGFVSSDDRNHGKLIKYVKAATENLNSYVNFWHLMDSCLRCFYNQKKKKLITLN